MFFFLQKDLVSFSVSCWGDGVGDGSGVTDGTEVGLPPDTNSVALAGQMEGWNRDQHDTISEAQDKQTLDHTRGAHCGGGRVKVEAGNPPCCASEVLKTAIWAWCIEKVFMWLRSHWTITTMLHWTCILSRPTSQVFTTRILSDWKRRADYETNWIYTLYTKRYP